MFAGDAWQEYQKEERMPTCVYVNHTVLPNGTCSNVCPHVSVTYNKHNRVYMQPHTLLPINKKATLVFTTTANTLQICNERL